MWNCAVCIDECEMRNEMKEKNLFISPLQQQEQPEAEPPDRHQQQQHTIPRHPHHHHHRVYD